MFHLKGIGLETQPATSPACYLQHLKEKLIQSEVIMIHEMQIITMKQKHNHTEGCTGELEVSAVAHPSFS